ncbi:hypothetical protein GCM10009567_05800 [Rothia amarae]
MTPGKHSVWRVAKNGVCGCVHRKNLSGKKDTAHKPNSLKMKDDPIGTTYDY